MMYSARKSYLKNFEPANQALRICLPQSTLYLTFYIACHIYVVGGYRDFKFGTVDRLIVASVSPQMANHP